MFSHVPQGDGCAAPVKPDKIVMSRTQRQLGKPHPISSPTSLCEWKCQLVFLRLAQPKECLGAVTV